MSCVILLIFLKLILYQLKRKKCVTKLYINKSRKITIPRTYNFTKRWFTRALKKLDLFYIVKKNSTVIGETFCAHLFSTRHILIGQFNQRQVDSGRLQRKQFIFYSLNSTVKVNLFLYKNTCFHIRSDSVFTYLKLSCFSLQLPLSGSRFKVALFAVAYKFDALIFPNIMG